MMQTTNSLQKLSILALSPVIMTNQHSPQTRTDTDELEVESALIESKLEPAVQPEPCAKDLDLHVLAGATLARHEPAPANRALHRQLEIWKRCRHHADVRA